MSRSEAAAEAELAEPATSGPGAPELLLPREVPLGGPRAMLVRRTLPHREIRTVGAWCFVDHYGPERHPMQVAAHPHTGLQTVTWLLAGEVLHRDSLGSRQPIAPGQLNLMTAGNGIAHAEDSVDPAAVLHGLQLWVALPAGARDAAPGFEHHADLPEVQVGDAVGRVIMGEFGGAASPATTYTPLVGVEVRLPPGRRVELPVEATYEHGAVLAEGDLSLADVRVPVGAMLAFEPGPASLVAATEAGATFLLLGGEPFGEPLLMWWNFVAREHSEILAAREAWEAGVGRFGPVDHPEPRMAAPALPTVTLRPRPSGRRTG